MMKTRVNTEKVAWFGRIVSIQPRIRLKRSFDERSHSYPGIVELCVKAGHPEPEFGEQAGSGWMARLAPVRDELLRRRRKFHDGKWKSGSMPCQEKKSIRS